MKTAVPTPLKKVVRAFILNGRQVFKVHYEDGDNVDYCLDELLPILVPEEVAKNFSKHKKIYNIISDEFTNGTANPSNLPFIAKVFSFKKVSTMSAKSLKSKHKKLDIP